MEDYFLNRTVNKHLSKVFLWRQARHWFQTLFQRNLWFFLRFFDSTMIHWGAHDLMKILLELLAPVNFEFALFYFCSPIESCILWFLSSFYKFLLQHYSFIFHFWINFLVLSKLSKAFIKFVQSLFQFFGAEIRNSFFVLFSLKVAHSTPAYVQNFNNDRRVSE